LYVAFFDEAPAATAARALYESGSPLAPRLPSTIDLSMAAAFAVPIGELPNTIEDATDKKLEEIATRNARLAKEAEARRANSAKDALRDEQILRMMLVRDAERKLEDERADGGRK